MSRPIGSNANVGSVYSGRLKKRAGQYHKMFVMPRCNTSGGFQKTISRVVGFSSLNGLSGKRL
eukprot:2849051-Lingulodinium_polyedra.AAC.1